MAKKDKNNLDQFFKEKLQTHTHNPRPQAWQKLSAALQEEKKPLRIVPPLWISSIAAALLLGLGVSLYWWQQGSGDVPSEQFVNTENTFEKDTTLSEDNQRIAEEENLFDGEEKDTEVATTQEVPLPEVNHLHQEKPSKKENEKVNKEKPKKEKDLLNDLDKNAPIRLKEKEQPVLVENTPKQENPDNKTGETVRVVVKVKLSGSSNASQQTQIAQNERKPKRKIDKVFKAIKDFKEGDLPKRDSLGLDEERLWASIGKK